MVSTKRSYILKQTFVQVCMTFHWTPGVKELNFQVQHFFTPLYNASNTSLVEAYLEPCQTSLMELLVNYPRKKLQHRCLSELWKHL